MSRRNVPDTPGADVAAVGSKRREAPVDGVGADSERRRQREHHSRVPQRKEETDPEGTFAVLKELTSRVADRRYVVDVERVPQTEGVGKRSQTAERRIAARVEAEQAPTEQVEQHDRRAEARQAEPVRVRHCRGPSPPWHWTPCFDRRRAASGAQTCLARPGMPSLLAPSVYDGPCSLLAVTPGGLTMLLGRRSECEMFDRRHEALHAAQSLRPLRPAPLLVCK
jgi:hypothetical protein